MKKRALFRPSRSTDRLVQIIAALRDREGGCAWSREQTFDSTARFTLEEARELADAIASNDIDAIRDELADLLYHVIFHATIAEESGAFNFGDVVKHAALKVLRRHPHVFGDAIARTPEEVDQLWKSIKDQEARDRIPKKPRGKKNRSRGSS